MNNVGTNSQRKQLSRKTKKNLFYLSVVILPLIQVLIFYFFVNLKSILFAFQNYNIKTGYTFVGLNNFQKFFSDLSTEERFIYAFKNSAVLYASTLLVGTGGAIIFSNYIYKKSFASAFFRITLFLPNIVSSIVLVTAFKFIMNQGVPLIYEMITGEEKLALISADPEHNFLYILIFNLWFSFGTQVLMYSSTMSGISTEIVESANLDGVTPFKELIKITIPMIFDTIVSFITIGIAGFFTNQMMIYTFFESSADIHLYNFGYYIFNETKLASTFKDYNTFCYLSAMGLSITVVVAPITIITRKLLRKYGPSEN